MLSVGRVAPTNHSSLVLGRWVPVRRRKASVFHLDPRCLFSSPGKNPSCQNGSSTNHVDNKVKPCLFPSSQKKFSAALRVPIWCRAQVGTGRCRNLFKASPNARSCLPETCSGKTSGSQTGEGQRQQNHFYLSAFHIKLTK